MPFLAHRLAHRATWLRAAAFFGLVPGIAAAATYRLTPATVAGGVVMTLTTMNEAGSFGGIFVGSGRKYGFIKRAGTVITFAPPPNTGSALPVPTSIDPNGLVAGYYYVTSPNGETDNSFGFVWQNTVYKSQFPMSTAIPVPDLSPGPTVVVNHTGRVAFVSQEYSVDHGVPPNLSSATVGPFTTVTSTNRSGIVAGWFTFLHGANTGNEGFKLNSGAVTDFLPKFATATKDVFINDSDQLAGVWTDQSNQVHGFIKTSAGFKSFDPWATNGSTKLPAADLHVSAFNNESYVAGVYEDDVNNMHAFVYHNGAYSVFGSWPYGKYGWATVVGVSSTGALALNAFDANGNPTSYIATCSGTGC